MAIGDLPKMVTSFDTNIAFHALEKGYTIHYSISPVILHSPTYYDNLWINGL